MVRLLNGQGNIVELDGTEGSAPQIDRSTGFQQCLQDHPGMHVIARQSGDFIHARGKEVMKTLLREYGRQFNALFAQNDDMALGAIEAIEAAGAKPGQDIKIVSIDAVKDGMQALIDGKINFIVECNPLLGDYAADLVKKVINGTDVQKQNYAKDGSFTQDQAKAVIDSRPY
jgi:ABC-type sugar transport system substrate-binding protein